MKKKIFLVSLILLALLFNATTITYAQVALPPPMGPLLTSVNPSFGEQGQTLELIISGENFQQEAQISFNPADGISINSINLITTTEIRINITIANDASLLPRDLIITNPDQLTGTFKQGFNIIPAPDRTPPPPILGLTATDAFDGKIDLAWIGSDVEDFGYYAIYWSEADFADVANLTPAAKISDQTTKTHQVTDLTDGIKYYFAVTAVDQNNNENKKVITANAIPTPSAVPPVAILIPTAPVVNQEPAPTTPPKTEKPTPTGLPAGLIPLIVAASLVALAGLTYLIKKYQPKKSLEEKKTEIKKEESFRFLNENSNLIKLEIVVNALKTVDIVREIVNLKIAAFSPSENGIPIGAALKIFDTQKDTLQKILGWPIPARELHELEYTIVIEPVSGIDIEWKIAEVSLGGQLQPSNKYEIKKQGDNFTYMKHVAVAKTDAAWKSYASDLQPEFADLKKIIQIHLDDLRQQKQKYEDLKKSFNYF